MKTYSGSCLCRQVKYQVQGELRDVIACHCTQCRKTSGHYVAATQAQTDNLLVDGEIAWFRSSEKARRGFCGQCGGNLFWQPGNRKTTSIFAGTLDGETGLQIVNQIHVHTKGDYYELPDVPVVDQTPIKTD